MTELGRRNRNFCVKLDSNRALFVKQTKASDPDSLANFKREMDYYTLAQVQSSWNQYLPRVLDIDRERHSIVLEFINHSESFTQYHWRIRRFSTLIASMVGGALADFHRSVTLADVPHELLQSCQRKPVWILDFDRVPDSASDGVKQMLATMQQFGGIRDGMQALKRDWRFDCLMHGDMKWDNCLIYPDEKQMAQLKLIDWELIDIGDARWDVAGLMHSFLVFWIETDLREIGQAPARDIVELIARENDLQAALRQSLQTFWRSYQNGLGRTEYDLHELESVLRFIAARLILTCYEGVFTAKDMSNSMSMVLQLAQLMFEDPLMLVKHWFAIATESRVEELEA